MADKMTGDKLLKKVKDCFKAASEAEAEQRAREKEDLEFQIPENQWDEAAKQYRRGTATTPGRPMLSVSLLSQPMALIQNQAVAAHLGVEIHPVSEQADPEVAEIKQGLYRRIERDSNAQLARLWALDRAKQCGRGWYRVNTQWDEDGDDPFDQEIVVERIWDQATVYADPAAQKPDFSDGKWVMVVQWIDRESFEEQYPGKTFPKGKDWAETEPDWVDDDAAVIAEYFWKEFEEETLKRGDRERPHQKVRVRRAICSLTEVLEESDWNGQYIPFVPVIGTEIQPFDGKRAWEGMVRKARDAQKYANFSLSTSVEAMAMEPKAPFVGAEGQFRGHEDEWLMANVRNQPTLEYRPISHEGQLVPPPARAQVDSSRMMLAMQAFGQARELVQAATNIYAPSLGETPKERTSQSGRAILALQQQSDAGTSHFLQNLANISMQYEARVVMDLMPRIYDRPGRVVQVLGTEDEPRMVMLNQPFVQDQKDRPQQIPAGMPPPPNTKVYDLNRGKYAVSVNVGKSYQTRLQEGATEIGEVLASSPQLMPLIGATYFRFRDFPGAKEIADILKKVRDKQFPDLEGEEGQGPTPEQMQGQIQQMGQMLQALQAQLKGAVQALETEQAKQQATMMKAQLDAQTRMGEAQLEAQTKREIAAADNATKLEIAQLSARVDEMLTLLKVQGEAYKIEAQAAHDDEQLRQTQEHDAVKTIATMKQPEAPKEKAK